MEKRKALLSAILLLPLLMSNAPAPGPFPTSAGFDLEINTANNTPYVELKNESEDVYIISVFDNIDSLTDAEKEFAQRYDDDGFFGNPAQGYMIPPGESVETPLSFTESADGYDIPMAENWEAYGIPSSYLVFNSQALHSSVALEDDQYVLTIDDTLKNPSENDTAFSAGVYCETDYGYYYCLHHIDIAPKKAETITYKYEIPKEYKDKEFKSLIVFDNSYYSNQYQGDPESPLAITAYVLLGILAVSLIGVVVFLAVRRKNNSDLLK